MVSPLSLIPGIELVPLRLAPPSGEATPLVDSVRTEVSCWPCTPE